MTYAAEVQYTAADRSRMTTTQNTFQQVAQEALVEFQTTRVECDGRGKNCQQNSIAGMDFGQEKEGLLGAGSFSTVRG